MKMYENKTFKLAAMGLKLYNFFACFLSFICLRMKDMIYTYSTFCPTYLFTLIKAVKPLTLIIFLLKS